MIAACIFDLDGVIVETAQFHFLAWKRLANELGFDFSEKENEKLKGISRMESLDMILDWGGVTLEEDKKVELATKKNEWYREFILKMTDDAILEGVVPFLKELKEKNIKIGLGSSSRNATTILKQIDLAKDFDAIIDGNHLTKSKPDPQVFQLGAEALGLEPKQCIVFEDAEAGIEAALAGGFHAVGVGSAEVLHRAHINLPNFKNISFDQLVSELKLTA